MTPRKNSAAHQKRSLGAGAGDDRPVALTVKIDGKTYVRLGTLRASQRRTHQDILKQALEEYLHRQGV